MATTWAQFRTATKTLITDVTASNDLFASACAAYVKSMIAREIDHDLQLSKSYSNMYMELRRRLLGYATTLAVGTTLDAAVRLLLPVDTDREGIQAYLTQQIKNSYQETIGPATLIEKLMREAVIDLQSHIECYRVGEETLYDDGDVTSMGNFSRGALPEQGELLHGFLLTAIDALAIDTAYVAGDYVSSNGRTYMVLVDGQIDDLGDGLETTDGSIEELDGMTFTFIYGEACLRSPLTIQTYFDRYQWNWLRTGCPSRDTPAMIAIDPQSHSFYLWPQLDEDNTAVLYWSGLKFEFADGDTVPFDESAQQAVREYVLSKYYLQVEHDASESKSHYAAYTILRARLFVDCRARQMVRK